MRVFTVRNVNESFPAVVNAIKTEGVRQASRNGPTLEFSTPVTTQYLKPRERVLFNPQRDHNPFFAFFETLWMLAGRDDLDFLIQFNKNMAQYSDDGRNVRGSAYGKRWRDWFPNFHVKNVPFDQLKHVINMLREDPDSRRAVLTQWDAASDPQIVSKDIPCNTHCYLKVRDGALNLTVCCRSNDVVYGAYGSNVVHFSMVQEYIASHLGVGVGSYYQVSDSLHVYTEFDVWKKVANVDPTPVDPYQEGITPWPMFDGGTAPELWDEDLRAFFANPDGGFHHSFFSGVAQPMWQAHMTYRDKTNPHRLENALMIIDRCVASDWRKACREWLERRQRAAQ